MEILIHSAFTGFDDEQWRLLLNVHFHGSAFLFLTHLGIFLFRIYIKHSCLRPRTVTY